MVRMDKLRERAGLTQRQLARKARVSRSTISMIECGKNKPSVKLAKKLGKIFEVEWTRFL